MNDWIYPSMTQPHGEHFFAPPLDRIRAPEKPFKQEKRPLLPQSDHRLAQAPPFPQARPPGPPNMGSPDSARSSVSSPFSSFSSVDTLDSDSDAHESLSGDSDALSPVKDRALCLPPGFEAFKDTPNLTIRSDNVLRILESSLPTESTLQDAIDATNSVLLQKWGNRPWIWKSLPLKTDDVWRVIPTSLDAALQQYASHPRIGSGIPPKVPSERVRRLGLQIENNTMSVTRKHLVRKRLIEVQNDPEAMDDPAPKRPRNGYEEIFGNDGIIGREKKKVKR